MQNELRQALTELMPPAAVVLATNPLVVDAPPANNNNAGGQPLNTARNVPAVEMRFEGIENYMVEKAKKELLELVRDLESKQMKALTQKISKIEELMRGHGMGYSFDFDDIMQFDRDKLPDKFKMPQLQKFDGTGDPRIHLSQYITTMSTTKALMSMVAYAILGRHGCQLGPWVREDDSS